MLPSILLVRSADPRWADIRAALQTQPRLRVLDDVTRAGHAAPAARAQRPTAIVVDAALGDRPVAALAAELHAASPASTIVVVGAAAQLDEETLLALWQEGVISFLTWDGPRLALARHLAAAATEDEVVPVSRVLLPRLLAALERRRAARVEGLVLTHQERVAGAAAAEEERRPAQPSLRVALLAHNAVLAATLRALCDTLAMPLAVVGTAEALLAAEGTTLFVDASADDEVALDRCVEVVVRATRPVHIIHPSSAIVDVLKGVARCEPHWLAPDVGVLTLFHTLAKLKLQASSPSAPVADAAEPRAPRPSYFTRREREVGELIETGCDTHQIAARLDMSESTAKTHILHVRLKQRLAPPGLP